MPDHSTWKITVLKLHGLEIFDNPKPPIFHYGTPYFDTISGCKMH